MQNFLKKAIIAVYTVYLSKLMTSILAKKKMMTSMFRANATSGQKTEVVLINTRFLCM
jgi:hypothetical protein